MNANYFCKESISCFSNFSAIKKSILVTGATGLIGKYLVSHLLLKTKLNIYCLIRNSDKRDLYDVIKSISMVTQSEFLSRIKIIPGDLKKPKLGISYKNYDLLSRKVSCIYHLGAEVNHIYSYNQLRLANVISTRSIIELALNYQKKKIIYVSSLSAAPSIPKNIISENFYHDWNDIKKIPDGYSMTKWASEYLLYDAANQGCEVKIIRPGWVLGYKSDFISLRNNHLLSLIKSCMTFHVAPDWDENLHYLPVEFLAQVIYLIAENGNEIIYNLTNINSVSWKSIIKWLNQQGEKIDLVPVEIWLNNYLKNIDTDNPLFIFSSLYIDSRYGRSKRPDITGNVDQSNTIKLFNQLKISYPSLLEDNFKKHFGLLFDKD